MLGVLLASVNGLLGRPVIRWGIGKQGLGGKANHGTSNFRIYLLMTTYQSDLTLSADIKQRLIEATRYQGRVKGLTHEFYRYPARFSPTFVREFIETFTKPGDWVFDPFVGGGTTLVEAPERFSVPVSLSVPFCTNAKIWTLSFSP